MRKEFLLSVFFLLAISLPAWANSGGGSPSATAGAVAGAQVTNNNSVTPTLAPSSNATVLSNQTTQINNHPTSVGVGQGGHGGLGVGGSALAVGGDQYMVLDQRNFSKVYNRQFYQARIDQSPNTMQYYGPYEKGVWNKTPIMGATWRVNPRLERKIKYFRMTKNIWQKRDPVSRVTIVGYGRANGDLLAQISVIVTEKQTTADALEIIKSESARIGGNIIEIIASDVLVVPTSEGWHIGTGVGASGIIGNDEKASVSGAGGTGYGKSSITRETRPYVTVRLWSGVAPKVNIVNMQEKDAGSGAPAISVKKLEER